MLDSWGKIEDNIYIDWEGTEEDGTPRLGKQRKHKKQKPRSKTGTLDTSTTSNTQKIEPIYRPFLELYRELLNQRREGGLIRDYINFAGHLQGTLNKTYSYIFSH